MIPSWKCKEVGIIVILGALLIVRTLMSIWLADVNGRVVKAIVNRDLKMFIYRVSLFLVFFRYLYFSYLRYHLQQLIRQSIMVKKS